MKLVLLSSYEENKFIYKELKRYKVKFSVQKNIKFSVTNKIANRLARAFKNFKILKF